jgi:oxygen-dependent protoporphyrinogen oxidase
MTETEYATVGIVGAGITGLALTHYLAERGIDSVAFETADEPGGVISTRTVDGHVLEAGPQRMRKTPAVAELAQAGDIEDDIIEARDKPLFVYADGSLRRAPLSIGEFLRTDLLSWRGKARLLAEPLTQSGTPEETAAELFTRKFGREAYEKFIGPLYGGIYGSNPAEMPAAYALDGLMKREQKAGSFLQAFRQRVGKGHESPPISFEGGNQQLPNALYETYSDRVELETPVEGIEPAEGDEATDGAAGDGGEVDTEGPWLLDTPARRYEVEHVVVTTPADVASDLLSDVATGTDGLAELRYNPLSLVFLHADHGREGKGYKFAFGEGFHTRGVSWNASMFGRDGVQTVFLGGMDEPELVGRPDDELGAIAREEFEQVMGTEASVIDVAHLEQGFPAWDSTWWNLADLEVPSGITLATNYTARMGIPSRVREARQVATRLERDEEGDGKTPQATPADD